MTRRPATGRLAAGALAAGALAALLLGCPPSPGARAPGPATGAACCTAGSPRPVVAAAPAAPADPAGADGPRLQRPCVRIPAGTYRPLLAPEGAPREVPVPAFRLDTHPVTNAEFLAFVTARPAWRRSRAARVFADERYLAHWASDLELGAAPPRAPVTHVSWFAARAFARWSGRRLPTVAEWERAAAPDALGDGAETTRRILDWYSRPTPEVLADVGTTTVSVHGVWDLHGLVWEWTEDWNGSLVTGDGRGDRDRDGGRFCGGGAIGAVRPEDYAAFMRAALRGSLEARSTTRNLGFRCAADDQEVP